MGEFAPIVYGEMAGFMKGIATDRELWKVSQKMNYSGKNGEYLIGFGVGFTNGQSVRKQLKQKSSAKLFNDNINTLKKLLDKRGIWWYGPLLQKIDAFIIDIDSWNSKNIPVEIYNETLNCINQKKTQRAVETIRSYYEKNNNLKTILEFEAIVDLLIDCRRKKRKGQIGTDESQKIKKQIEINLIEWLSCNKENSSLKKGGYNPDSEL